jgi:hypothetical protein
MKPRYKVLIDSSVLIGTIKNKSLDQVINGTHVGDKSFGCEN